MINNLFREDLKEFKAYVPVLNDKKVILNANESFLNLSDNLMDEALDRIKDASFNRYPDGCLDNLTKLYSDFVKVSKNNVMVGNGSDELISIIIYALLNENDSIVTLSPDFSMYKNYALVKGAKVLEYKLDYKFNLDMDRFIEFINENKPKLVFLSNPNNPTGNIIEENQLIKLIEKVNSIVVIDEAYVEFYGKSIIEKIYEYDNLIVLRTSSKALGLAGLRLGFLITGDILYKEVLKAKPPYNVNKISSTVGEVVLENPEIIKDNINKIIESKLYIENNFKNFPKIKSYKSYTNFVLIKYEHIEALYKYLSERDISIRIFNGELQGFARISSGTLEENNMLLKTLKSYFKEMDND
ncbi:MAG: histidinol-phosphate transaminase [Clostridiaceae bacterium]